jgi:predicted nucleic acid-binding protein
LGAVRQELLSGLREPSEVLRLRNLLRDFPDIELLAEDYEGRRAQAMQCRRRGSRGYARGYMLICAVVLHHGWQIFSTDRDFVHYARAVPIQMFLP